MSQIEKILQSVYALVDNETVDTMTKAIKAVEKARDDYWQEWLNQDTELTILANHTKCLDCGCKIKIDRKAKTIHVTNERLA